MHNLPMAMAALAAATIHLDTRPPRGRGSIDASTYLQALVLGVCAAWAVAAWFLLDRVLRAPPAFADLGAAAAFAATLARLGRPWRRDLHAGRPHLGGAADTISL